MADKFCGIILDCRLILDKNLKKIHEHMLALGLAALAHANSHANYFSYENGFWNELSVIQAAHAAEILIKARIAKEHPLLIFENIPNGKDCEKRLTIKTLISQGRTFQYRDLPDRLWATTGIRIPNQNLFQEFGRLRNSIQHFAVPNDDIAQRAVDFIYGVIDPLINECWGLYAIDYNEDHEPYIYLIEGLIRRGTLFLVSPDSAANFGDITFEWPRKKKGYQLEMERRFKEAMQNKK